MMMKKLEKEAQLTQTESTKGRNARAKKPDVKATNTLLRRPGEDGSGWLLGC